MHLNVVVAVISVRRCMGLFCNFENKSDAQLYRLYTVQCYFLSYFRKFSIVCTEHRVRKKVFIVTLQILMAIGLYQV